MSSPQASAVPPERKDLLANEHVRLLNDRLRTEFSLLPDELRRRVTEPLESRLRRVAERHSAIVAKLGKRDDSGGAVEPRELSDFRKAALSEVSAFLVEGIRELNAGETVGSLFIDRFERLSRIAVNAPETISVSEDSSVYQAAVDDAVPRRLYKSWLRSSRRVRLWRGAVARTARWLMKRRSGPLPVTTRSVELRQLLRFHVEQRIATALLPLHERLQQAVAQRHAMLERAATEWTFAVLALGEEFGLDELVRLGVGNQGGGESDTASDDEPRQWEIGLDAVAAAAERMAGGETPVPLEGLADEFERVLDQASRQLSADLACAGTPLLKPAVRWLPESGSPALTALKASGERWTGWHRQVVNRLLVNRSVMALREQLAERATTILRDVRAQALKPVLAVFDSAERWIEDARPRVDRAFDREMHGGPRDVADTLRAVAREAAAELERLFPDAVAREAQSALTEIGLDHWQHLAESVSQLPAGLMVHGHMHEPGNEVEPTKRAFSIDLRDIAASALSPAWPEILAEAAEPLKAKITRAWVGAAKLDNVIEYNLGAAIEELLGAGEERGDAGRSGAAGGEAPAPSSSETARKLAADALRRSVESVQDLRASLDEPWAEFARAFDAAVHDDWSDLINQVRSDDLMRERWVGMRTRALRRAERLQDQAERLWKSGLAVTSKRAAVARRYAAQLIRRGRFAVGVADTAGEEESQIAEALRGAEDVRKALPTVYRRLFTFGVLTETALLEGRGRDLVSVRRRYEQWKAGAGPGTLVMLGRVGSGRSSFLKALLGKVFVDGSAQSLELNERVGTESEFAVALSEGCGLARSPGGLREVEVQLAGLRPKSTVVLIDNLEHLMLQSTGGTDLLRQVLSLMVRTDHAVFWVATVTDEAWRYVAKAISSSAASVGTIKLTELGRKDVEDVVLNRHHRSGMTLSFTAPRYPTPLLKRRLRRARTQEKRQAILQEIYFDALHRHSGNDIALALLYWLLSVEFRDDGDLVSVRPFEGISFGQLKQLDLERLFALKALVLHNTLTAAELAVILRISIDRCGLILETLLNLALIERAGGDGTSLDQIDTVTERFRLSRFVVHPVVQRLRDARVLY